MLTDVGVCECLQFHDDWTPAHLTGGRTNLYREVDVALNYQLEQQMAQSTGENTDSYDPFEMDPAKVYVVSL